MKNGGKPPRGMYINHDDLVTLATGPALQGDTLLKGMDREIVSLKRNVSASYNFPEDPFLSVLQSLFQVQNNKQILSTAIRRTLNINVEPYRIPDPSTKLNARWTNEELLLGVQGVRKFGKNFGVIAEVIGTKTESHVRSFFVNYRRRYNLDNALKECEAEHGPSGIETPPAEPEEPEEGNSNDAEENGK